MTIGNGESEDTVEEVLDTLGDPYARTILAHICREPRSTEDLATALDYSVQTVDRRTDLLEKHGLISSYLRPSEDGNHTHVYKTAFESVRIALEEQAFDIHIEHQENLADQFATLWDDLSHA